MPGLLPSDVLAEFRSATPSLFPVVEIQWPDQTRYYSEAGVPVSSSSLGYCSPQVEAWDDIAPSLPDYRAGVQAIATSVTLSDIDRTINGLMAGRYRNRVEGSIVRMHWLSANFTAQKFYDGVISSIERVSTFRWRIGCRTNDGALMRGSFQIPTIDNYTYANAVADMGKFLPLPFGAFDSNDGTVVGCSGSLKAIKLGLSDGTGGFPYRYLAGLNWLVSIKRVCVSGVPIAGATWVRKYTDVRGLTVSEIWLANDPVDAPVTFDGMGVSETVAGSSLYASHLGTGEVIRNPTRQMQYLLLNHVFNAYRPMKTIISGAAGVSAYYDLGSTAIMDNSWTTSAAYDDQRLFRGCIPPIVDASTKPAQVFADWCRAWGKRPYWTPEGRLALALCDWDVDPAELSGTQHLRYVKQGTENNFNQRRTSRSDSLDKITSRAWIVPAANNARTVFTLTTADKAGSNVDVVESRFADAWGVFDPTVMPTAVTRVYLADGATQSGNTYLRNNIDLNSLQAQQFAAATALGTGGITPPKFRCGSDVYTPNGRPYLGFDVAGARWMYGEAGDSLGAIITAAEHTIWVVFKFTNATLFAGTNLNHPIVTDQGGGFTGIYLLKNLSNEYRVYAHGYDGAHRLTPPIQVYPETWYIARARHYGGNLYFSIDNWSEVSVACGNLTSTAGLLAIGGVVDGRGAIYSDIGIAALVVANSGNMTAQGNDTDPTHPGNHDGYRIWAGLKERYGVA